MCARRSSAIELPSDLRTVLFDVLSWNGVCTASDALNGLANGDGEARLAPLQKAPNRTAPRWAGSQCRFQWASTSQALPILILPPEAGANPWLWALKLWHMLTSAFLISLPAESRSSRSRCCMAG